MLLQYPLFSDTLSDCGVKKEGDSTDRWTSSQMEVIPEIAQAADNPTATRSPETQVSLKTNLPAEVLLHWCYISVVLKGFMNIWYDRKILKISLFSVLFRYQKKTS